MLVLSGIEGAEGRLMKKNRWKRVENDEKLSLIWKNKPNLWKAKMNVSIYMEGGYDDLCGFGRRENKANSKPNKANFSEQGPEDRERKDKIVLGRY